MHTGAVKQNDAHRAVSGARWYSGKRWQTANTGTGIAKKRNQGITAAMSIIL